MKLVRKFDVCFFEDLNLDSMKRLWDRKISDLAFGEFMQKIEWQAIKRVKEVQTIGRFKATTLICHKCGDRTDIELKVRQWTCHNCPINHERDVNAAINIIAQVGHPLVQ